MNPITKAIIPVAGIGTRFLPASKAQPKEMLPVVDKPVIQYIVEEMAASGIKDIIFVTSIGKRALEDHFDRNFELEYRLEQKGKLDMLKEVSQIGKLANFAFVRQHKPMGDGHAILSALDFIGPDESVLMSFGDDIMDADVPAAQQMIDVYNEHQAPVVLLTEVPESTTHRYGIAGGDMVADRTMKINAFIEKPEPGEAPSNFAVSGRYILTPDILQRLRTQEPGKGGEIRVADAIMSHVAEGEKMYGCVLDGRYFDCGNKLRYLQAQVHYGLKHPELKEDLANYLKEVC